MTKKLEEGKISKWLTAPLRRRRAINNADSNADKHRAKRDKAAETANELQSIGNNRRISRDKTNYFHPRHDEVHKQMKNYYDQADKYHDKAAAEGRKTSANSRRALKLVQGKRATPFGGLKEETMNPITQAIANAHDGKLEEMRQNFNTALAQKAVEKLEEKKLEIASNIFGIK